MPSDSDKVLVPPAGIHTPGRTAMPADDEGGGPLVEVPADATSDPEGVRAALKARAEGNFVTGPAHVAHQDSSGRALTKGELDDADKAEKQAREALHVGEPPLLDEGAVAPKVGEQAKTKSATKQ